MPQAGANEGGTRNPWGGRRPSHARGSPRPPWGPGPAPAGRRRSPGSWVPSWGCGCQSGGGAGNRRGAGRRGSGSGATAAASERRLGRQDARPPDALGPATLLRPASRPALGGARRDHPTAPEAASAAAGGADGGAAAAGSSRPWEPAHPHWGSGGRRAGRGTDRPRHTQPPNGRSADGRAAPPAGAQGFRQLPLLLGVPAVCGVQLLREGGSRAVHVTWSATARSM